jgi:leucyl aminopeptidase
MKFQPKAEKGAVVIEFIKDTLGRFDGTTLSVPFGETKPLSRRRFILQMRKSISLAKQNKIKSIAIDFKDIKALAPTEFTDHEAAKIAATAFIMANYEHTTYKTRAKDAYAGVETVALLSAPKEAIQGVALGEQIGRAVNATRELSNTPGGDMTPKILASAAKAAAKTAGAGAKLAVKVLGRKEIEKVGMGAVLGIAKGSAEEPQFIVMEYKGGPQSQKPVVLVGKGVTFDTGGLQIKPGDHMYEMHMDMSGGAAVINTIALAAKLKLKVNVVALVPAVENAASGSAVRPGDMLKSLSGKTIEILHTDAEGRVILADAITYAKRYNPAIVVDVATLTGAALIALGEQASAVMMRPAEPNHIMKLLDLAERSGDYVWPMPLWEEYDDMVKGKFGDVPNISTAGNSRYGGVIAGGKFLEVFAKELDCPWVHIDMAPKMTAAAGEFLAKGAAGAPVRLLLAIVDHHANHPAR